MDRALPRALFSTDHKVDGMVLEIGDSITHANPYAQWPRSGAPGCPDDAAALAWMHAAAWSRANQADASSRNGWYLAAADTSTTRGMTASSGIDSGEMLSGDGNGGAAMPAIADAAAARAALCDGQRYPRNLNLATIACAFAQAQIAVVMLGTNDAAHAVAPADFLARMSAIVGLLEARRMVVVLSTIPPLQDPAREARAVAYCQGLARFARAHGLPLIDFRAEILARQAAPACFGTLIGGNDPHPTAHGGAYSAASDPYQDGGDARTHATGAAAAQVGYLLRSWLTVQKLEELRMALATP